MRIVFISDTHGLHGQMHHPIPDGDVLVHCGDVSNVGEIRGIQMFTNWLYEFPHEHKIVIAGNHDWGFELQPAAAEACFDNTGITYLRDKHTIIDGVKFYGSPWQPEFCDWAFNVPRGEKLAAIWSNIPEDTDVLITHGPPFGILDFVHYGQEYVGCADLMARVKEVKPKIHAFGHIHETYGNKYEDGTLFLNPTICTLRYVPSNEPIVVDFDTETKDVVLV